MHADTIERIVLMLVIVPPLAFFLSPIARGLGIPVIVVGVGATSKGTSWGPATLFVGVMLWVFGHWSFIIQSNGMYRSRLARAVFDHTPLVVMLPGWWRVRRQRRDARETSREAQRRARGEVIEPRLASNPPTIR